MFVMYFIIVNLRCNSAFGCDCEFSINAIITMCLELASKMLVNAFFIFTTIKRCYLSQTDIDLILKLIKGTSTPLNVRSIAFQMGAGCVIE